MVCELARRETLAILLWPTSTSLVLVEVRAVLAAAVMGSFVRESAMGAERSTMSSQLPLLHRAVIRVVAFVLACILLVMVVHCWTWRESLLVAAAKAKEGLVAFRAAGWR